MKHYYRSLLTAVAAGLVLFTTASCTDEKDTELNIQDIKGSASVEGKVTYNQDKNSATSEEIIMPASGTIVYFTLQLNSLAGTYQGQLVYSTTTDSQGEYNITLPATPEGLRYVVRVESFKAQGYEVENGVYSQKTRFFKDPNTTTLTVIENIDQYHSIDLGKGTKIQ